MYLCVSYDVQILGVIVLNSPDDWLLEWIFIWTLTLISPTGISKGMIFNRIFYENVV